MKGNSGTRSVDKTHLGERDVNNYIQAFTAKGGQDFSFFSKYDTLENRDKFLKWIDDSKKVNGDIVYRGSHILSGDLYKFILGEVKDGDEVTLEQINGEKNAISSFTLDPNRIYSYQGYTPKPNPKYDRFDNESQRIVFEIHTKGKTFVDISKRSHYPEEMEVVARGNSKYRYRRMIQDRVSWRIILEEI